MGFDGLCFDNGFARLAEEFGVGVQPQPLSSARLVSWNLEVAGLLGLEEVGAEELVAVCSGNRIPQGAQPLAAVYAGHQFGVYVPQLGDGRALLLGEVVGVAGSHWELQLKGSGATPFSRGSDGRAVLRSSIREYLCSVAMQGLGIPTTQVLCLVASEDQVYREQVETAAICMRVSRSFLRFGSFEYYRWSNPGEGLGRLASYALTSLYPECADDSSPYLAMFREIVARTARLIAHWQAVGFAHGVMNTDNMSLLGETLDYGPYGFMERYDPGLICNHSDHAGRYAFDQQPRIGQWNCGALGAALLPLIEDEEAVREVLAHFQQWYLEHYLTLMRAKLGLQQALEGDWPLVSDLLELLSAGGEDYTLFFRRLSAWMGTTPPEVLFVAGGDPEQQRVWLERYLDRLERETSQSDERHAQMRAVNPIYILRNYMAQEAIEASQQGDDGLVQGLLRLLQNPYPVHSGMERYANAPPDWASTISVSCSS